MNAGQSSDPFGLCFLRAAKTPDPPPVEISEAPWSQTKACDAEECIEDLRVDFNPYSSWGIDIIAGRVAHGRRGVAEE